MSDLVFGPRNGVKMLEIIWWVSGFKPPGESHCPTLSTLCFLVFSPQQMVKAGNAGKHANERESQLETHKV